MIREPVRGGGVADSSGGDTALRLGTQLINVCILVIAVSLGLILYVRTGFTLIEAGLSATLAGLIMALAQGRAARLRERLEISNALQDLRSADEVLSHDLQALRGTAAVIDDLNRRVASLEAALPQDLLQQLDERIDAEIAYVKSSLVGEMQTIEELVRTFADSAFVARAAEAAADEQDPDFADGGDAAREFGPPAELEDARLLASVRRAIDDARIDLHLQPIVTLPQRKVRYYEVLSRLRGSDGEQIAPVDFLRVAEPAGLLAMVDNLVLFRAVQVVRRLIQRNREMGLFCNISAQALADADFFPHFVEFIERDKDIAGALVFEMTQATLNAAGPIEMESMIALQKAGFRFSMDHVTSLDIDPRELSELGFRFVKVNAGLLLLGGEKAGAQIHPADLSSLLARHGIELIAEKIEQEASVVNLLDFEVVYGQGYLFSEPRLVRGDLRADDADPRVLRQVG